MLNIVSKVKSSFAVYSALFITVLTTKVRSQDSCRTEELMKCAKPLTVLDSGPTFATSKSDLDKICPDLEEAIRCIHKYTRFCMKEQHRRHFKTLFHGTVQMAKDLCKNESFQEEYLRHAPCMKRVEPSNEICFKRYTRAMNEIQSKSPENATETENDYISYQKRKRAVANENIKNVCCSFQEYVECSTHTMKRECGDEAAHFSRRFLDKMSLSMIELHCGQYGHRECGLMSSSNTVQISTLLSIILATLSIILVR